MKKVNEPEQAQKVIIIKQDIAKWKFPSTSREGFWIVKYHKGELSCNCPSAIYKYSGSRRCKHIKYLLDKGVPFYEQEKIL